MHPRPDFSIPNGSVTSLPRGSARRERTSASIDFISGRETFELTASPDRSSFHIAIHMDHFVAREERGFHRGLN